MSDPDTPNAKRATTLRFDPDRVFSKPPFSDDDAVELITDAAVEALVAHFDRPLPQSNIGDAIAIVRLHVDYLQGVGIVDAALARRATAALDAHATFLDTLMDADAYGVEAYDPFAPSNSEPMEIGASYYDFHNVTARAQLEALGPMNMFDWFGSLAYYVTSVGAGNYRRAAGAVLVLAALGLWGPGVLEVMRFGLPDWMTGGILTEYNILRRLEEDATVRGFIVQLQQGLELRQAVLGARRGRALDPRGLHLSTIGTTPAEVATYHTQIARFTRRLYAGTSRAFAVGGVAAMIAAIVADVAYRYKPDRCREWLRRNGDATRAAWRRELDGAMVQLDRFRAFNGQLRDDFENLATANDGWQQSLEAGIDTLFDPCDVVEKIRPFLAEFIRVQGLLESAPYMATVAVRRRLEAFVQLEAQFAALRAQNGPANVNVAALNEVLQLFLAVRDAFFSQPVGGGRLLDEQLIAVASDLNRLVWLLKSLREIGGLSPADTAELARLRGLYGPDGVGGGGGGDERRPGDGGSGGGGRRAARSPGRGREAAELLEAGGPRVRRRLRTSMSINEIVDLFIASRPFER